MKLHIRTALDRLEEIIDQPATHDFSRLLVTLPPIQDAYEEIIQQALILLTRGQVDESMQLLRVEQEALAPILDRLPPVIEAIDERNDPMLKLIVEYLQTRMRLVSELKMFPEFGLELLKELSPEDSLDKTIYYLESTMTARGGLYQQIMKQVKSAH
ncbi:MAG: hypothetical protein O2868_15150 [Proteobacteria bacterium]|nr:hypothetical protein [Pseudomonadota bacterium]